MVSPYRTGHKFLKLSCKLEQDLCILSIFVMFCSRKELPYHIEHMFLSLHYKLVKDRCIVNIFVKFCSRKESSCRILRKLLNWGCKGVCLLCIIRIFCLLRSRKAFILDITDTFFCCCCTQASFQGILSTFYQPRSILAASHYSPCVYKAMFHCCRFRIIRIFFHIFRFRSCKLRLACKHSSSLSILFCLCSIFAQMGMFFQCTFRYFR